MWFVVFGKVVFAVIVFIVLMHIPVVGSLLLAVISSIILEANGASLVGEDRFFLIVGVTTILLVPQILLFNYYMKGK